MYVCMCVCVCVCVCVYTYTNQAIASAVLPVCNSFIILCVWCVCVYIYIYIYTHKSGDCISSAASVQLLHHPPHLHLNLLNAGHPHLPRTQPRVLRGPCHLIIYHVSSGVRRLLGQVRFFFCGALCFFSKKKMRVTWSPCHVPLYRVSYTFETTYVYI